MSFVLAAQGGTWIVATTSDGSGVQGHDESSYVKSGSKYYLLGARGNQYIQEYDPVLKTWTVKSQKTPDLNHFQAVDYKGKIYIIGAFTGPYPNETPVPVIYIYDPVNDVLSIGDSIPKDRQRGSAGVAVYNNNIYIVSGITNGHIDGYVKWFDEYDPATGTWTKLADAPRARDHFNVAIVGDKLYAASGRTSAYPNTFGLTIPEVDVYDFTTQTWSTLPNNLPTERGGAAVTSLGNELVVIGGESLAHTDAHTEVEALNTTTNTWQTLAPLHTGRHGTSAITDNGNIFIAGGISQRGGTESVAANDQEIFTPTIAGVSPKQTISFATYPNPFFDNLTIITSNKKAIPLFLELFDMTGKKWGTFKCTSGESFTIPSNIKPNLYLARILTANGEKVENIMLQKGIN